MAKMTEKQLRKRDAKRNLGEELLQAAREVKAGKATRVHLIDVSTPAGLSLRVSRIARPQKDTSLHSESRSTFNERPRRRLTKDRPTTTIAMRIPVDVVDSLKAIASARGFATYQTLLWSYIGEGLRRDEGKSDRQAANKLDRGKSRPVQRKGDPQERRR